MRRQFIAATRMVVVITVVTGLAYPLAVTLLAQAAMRGPADGSLVDAGGRPVGSSLIGQSFTGPAWFHGRPDAYDPSASGASNLGPSNPALGKQVREAAAAVRAQNGLTPGAAIPVDAVTTSGSGLDPDISPAYAALQAPRVARARGLALTEVLRLIADHTSGPTLGVLGEQRVNVLLLNLAVMELASSS